MVLDIKVTKTQGIGCDIDQCDTVCFILQSDQQAKGFGLRFLNDRKREFSCSLTLRAPQSFIPRAVTLAVS